MRKEFNMRKTLSAIAVLGAFAASASAADVSLYGRIDTGLAYTNTDQDRGDAFEQDKFEMTTGFSTGSRWGIKGTEDLGSGLKVGFILESGFDSDTGELNNDGRLFGRESTMILSGGFGTLYAGRMGSVMSDAGSVGWLVETSVVGNAYGVTTMKGSTGAAFARIDNALAYVTPVFGGFQAAAQYSFKMDSKKDGTEGKADTDRYAALGLKYASGPLTVMAVGDYTIYGHKAGETVDDGWNVLVGGNYDFGPAKVFAKATYFDNMRGILDSFKVGDEVFIRTTDDAENTLQYKGYGLEFGTSVPLWGGSVLANVGWRQAEMVDDSDDEYKRFNAGVGYAYAFSKRTNVYTIVNYAQEKSDLRDETAQVYQFGLGLVHKF